MRIINLVILSCVFLFTMSSPKKKNLHVVFISGSNEYVSHVTLKEYKRELEATYANVKVTILQANGPLNEKNEYSNLDGTDVLKDCDVLLTFVRRTTISGKAIDDIKNYVASGKPLVALRTSSHGFQSWPEFDKEVLGGNYNNHYKGEPEKREIGADGMAYTVGEPTGAPQVVTVNSENRSHPVLAGVNDFVSKYSLYKTAPIASDAKLLLTGKTEEGEEPVAWTREQKGSKVVYIALGGVQDWRNPIFVRLVTNALFWAADFSGRKNETQ
jgi:type 1 glutamine amidotransferase